MTALDASVREELLGDGRLLSDHFTIPNPAAGAGLVYKLDSGAEWRFLALRFQLATSIAAGNRFVTVDVCDPEGTVWLGNPAPAVVAPSAAGQVFDFADRNYQTSGIAGAPMFAQLYKLWLPGGWQLRINVANIDVADQLSGIRAYVEKYQPRSR